MSVNNKNYTPKHVVYTKNVGHTALQDFAQCDAKNWSDASDHGSWRRRLRFFSYRVKGALLALPYL